MKQTMCYEEAYEANYVPVFHYINRLLANNPSVSEELTQETFLRLVTHIDSMEDAEHVRRWLLHVAHNLTVDYIRKNQRLHLFDDVSDLIPPLSYSNYSDDISLRQEIRELLKEILEYVNSWDEASAYIYLSRIQGISAAQIGKTLHMQPSKIEGRYQRLRNRVIRRFQLQWRSLGHDKKESIH